MHQPTHNSMTWTSNTILAGNAGRSGTRQQNPAAPHASACRGLQIDRNCALFEELYRTAARGCSLVTTTLRIAASDEARSGVKARCSKPESQYKRFQPAAE